MNVARMTGESDLFFFLVRLSGQERLEQRAPAEHCAQD